ncbi:hypothetical protein HGRIS_013399 [Hohenbuehelia grisea]|uniref:Uncharacterized protein n=1 Tax=Hohenbuehelia grisea TaxID=104357 RepID=A0ABR3IVK3_9AGAR
MSSSSRKDPLKGCIQNGSVFTALGLPANRKNFPVFPPRDHDHFFLPEYIDSYEPADFYANLSWTNNYYPQLPCLSPGITHDRCSVLHRLNFAFDTIPIEQTSKRFHLCAELQTSWHELEELLLAAGHVLYSRTPMPLEMSYLPLPETYGYRRAHKTAKIARNDLLLRYDIPPNNMPP